MNPPFISILTSTTCGESCWHAKEEICRCSCGGKNHGCLKHGGENQPERTAKIDGERYKLVAVGLRENLIQAADEINGRQFKIVEPAQEITSADGSKWWHQYRYNWRETDPGAPARIKYASREQLYKWRELTGWRDRGTGACLLWEICDMPARPFTLLVDKQTGEPLPEEQQKPNKKP